MIYFQRAFTHEWPELVRYWHHYAVCSVHWLKCNVGTPCHTEVMHAGFEHMCHILWNHTRMLIKWSMTPCTECQCLMISSYLSSELGPCIFQYDSFWWNQLTNCSSLIWAACMSDHRSRSLQDWFRQQSSVIERLKPETQLDVLTGGLKLWLFLANNTDWNLWQRWLGKISWWIVLDKVHYAYQGWFEG